MNCRSSTEEPDIPTFDSPNWTCYYIGQFRFFGIKCSLFCCCPLLAFIRFEELLEEVSLIFVFDATLGLKIFDSGFGVQGRGLSKIRAKLFGSFVLVTKISNLNKSESSAGMEA